MEVAIADHPGQWTKEDREHRNKRWFDAQLFIFCQAVKGTPSSARNLATLHYSNITERAAFYDWFDQVRVLQGHETVWPGTAWLVADRFSPFDSTADVFSLNFALQFAVGYGELLLSPTSEYYQSNIGTTLDLINFAQIANKTIFDDVYSIHLADLFRRGLQKNPLRGNAAAVWDEKMVEMEQMSIVEPVYQKHVLPTHNHNRKTLNALMNCGRVVGTVGGLTGGSHWCRPDLDAGVAHDRFRYGTETVIPIYKKDFMNGKLASRRQGYDFKPSAAPACNVSP